MSSNSNGWAGRSLVTNGINTTKNRKTYTYEEKLAAVQAHVDGGMSASAAMEKYDVRSKSAFFRWCDTYKREGAEGLTPKRRGRPRKNRS